MKRTIRKLAGLLSVVLCLSLGVLAVPAQAAGTQNLTTLLTAGTIKPLGRTQVNLAGNGITADWSGSGFDVNVTGGGKLTVGYKASYSNYWAVLVDGEQIWRGNLAANTSGGTFSVTIPAGTHTVRVVKETQISTSTTAYSMLTTLTFDGTIEAVAPAKKDLYIEFIGDSYSCGDGAIGVYTPGVQWLAEEDSATHAFTYYTAQELDADYSIVARGGIGLFSGSFSAEEGTYNASSMPGIYEKTSGYNSNNGNYGFERQPDVVVIELGANDGVSASNKERWSGLMKAFVEMVREKNPDAQILLTSHTSHAYTALMDVVEQLQAEDAKAYAKLHTFLYDFLGTGSAALTTQYAGHIGVDDNKAFAEALASFIRSEDLIPEKKDVPTYSDIAYYVSENGDDSNDGKSIETAKKTLKAVFDQAKADNGNSTEFAADTRIMIYVEGTVLTNSANSQTLGGDELFRKAGGTIRDHIPVVLTTYNYSGQRATIQMNHKPTMVGNDSVLVFNDMEFKDIALYSETSDSGFASRRLFASGCQLIFDNASLTTDGKATGSKQWFVAADRFCNGGITTADSTETLNSTIIFRNGDYTNLDYVTAVFSDSIWINNDLSLTEAPALNCKLIIDDGAKMGKVYGRYGTLNVGSAKVEIHGGEVAQYVGTTDGKSSTSKRVYTGDVDLLITGGHIGGSHFSTTGKFVTINGDINTEITGGIFSIVPTGTDGQYEGYFFGGNQNCVVANINTTISGGQFYLFFDAAADSGYYFGVAGSGTVHNVTNKISCGAFLPVDRAAKGKNCGVYLGCHVGSITGTLTNEISGGNFMMWQCGASDRGVYAGTRGVNWPIGKIVNIIGKEGTDHGPTFVGGVVSLGAGWAQVGVSSKTSAMPAVTECSDTVVISNTIYGGEFNDATLNLGATSAPNLGGKHYSFVKGSIESDIYGGFFMKDVYGAGNCPVYGHVTTNIYGGHFKNVYGGTSSASTIYDGVELNIYGVQEYYGAGYAVHLKSVEDNKKNPNVKINYDYINFKFCAGNKSGAVPVPVTAGRDSVRLTVVPEEGTNLVINTKVEMGAADGTTSAVIAGKNINFKAPDEIKLPSDAPYYLEYTENGGYQAVKGYRNAGAFIDFGSSLDFALYLQADNGIVEDGDSCTIIQTKEGSPVALSAERVSVEVGTGRMANMLIVTAHGITAKEMRDDLTFTLTKGGEVWFTETLSVYDAAKQWQASGGSSAYKTMLADMIAYGTQAQTEFGYNLAAVKQLPDLSGATATAKRWTKDESAYVTPGYESKVGTSLNLNERIELNIYIEETFTPDELAGITATLGGKATTDFTVTQVEDGLICVTFDKIKVTRMKDLVELHIGDFTVRTSVKEYVVASLAVNNQPQLMKALQKYVDSVCTYLETVVGWIEPGENETDPFMPEFSGTGN